jgi:hypothetical protein
MVFFQPETYNSLQPGTTFEEFSHHFSVHQPFVKQQLMHDEDYFSCFLKGAEVIFVSNKISTVEISNLPIFFGITKGEVKKLSIDKTIELFESNNIAWQIYPKYTKEQDIVLLANGILYEFGVIEGKFRLVVVRLEAV